MRSELMAVRISDVLPGHVKQRVSDAMTHAETKSDGSCSSSHGSARIPAPSLDLLGWIGSAVRVVDARLDRAIPMSSVSVLCRGAARSGGASTTRTWNVVGSPDPEWLSYGGCHGYPPAPSSPEEARGGSPREPRYPISRTRLKRCLKGSNISIREFCSESRKSHASTRRGIEAAQ
jgi:hypothetical protein